MLYGALEALPGDSAKVPEALTETMQLVHTMLRSLCKETPAKEKKNSRNTLQGDS